jgi:hypothetical protein
MFRIYIVILSIFCFSCIEKQEYSEIILGDDTASVYPSQTGSDNINDIETIYIPQKMPADIFCDLDGDGKNDTIGLRLDAHISKYGLVIQYAAGRCDTLGMGKAFLDRGFNDFNWAGIMEVAPKGEFYWNYANYDDPDISRDQIQDEDKITLTRAGVFLHADESCGGGVIYLNDDHTYAWMQQE